MARTVQDDELRDWEAFASTGPYGYAERASVVFRCLTDAAQRPRTYAMQGDKSDAEAWVARASRDELREMLAGAEPLA